MPKLIFNNPIRIETGTGVSGSVDGVSFETQEFSANSTQNVTLFIGQAVETTSNTTFNNVTSSNGVKVDSLILGDGFISSSNSVVAHTGSVVVTGNTIAPSMNLNGQLNAQKFEISVTGSTTIQKSGSTIFGDTLDDTHDISGSNIVSSSYELNNYSITEISNDTSLTDSSTTSLVTENAVKSYVNTNVIQSNSYLRKQFFKTSNSITIPSTASFSAISASAPTGLTSTSKNDFVFFINGQYMEHDALDIQQVGSTFHLIVNNDSIGYDLETDDEILAIGKFNS